MAEVQMIIITAALGVWLLMSVAFLVSTVQGIVFDRRREKREQEELQMARETHVKCMSK